MCVCVRGWVLCQPILLRWLIHTYGGTAVQMIPPVANFRNNTNSQTCKLLLALQTVANGEGTSKATDKKRTQITIWNLRIFKKTHIQHTTNQNTETILPDIRSQNSHTKLSYIQRSTS